MIKGFLLAAGLGTRLQPLTKLHSKPSLPVLGVPALWFGASHLARSFNIQCIGINVSHASETLRTAINDVDLVSSEKINFYVSDETDHLLGSSGALWKIKDWVGTDDLAVQNADRICPVNWNALFDFHKKKNADMTIHVRSFKSNSPPYSNVEIDKSGKVIKFSEQQSEGRMFSGSYLLDAKCLKMLPHGVSDTKKTLFDPLIERGKLYAYDEDVPWIDIGSIELFYRAQFKLLVEIPEFRSLVTLKMKEVSPHVWIDQSCEIGKLKLKKHTVLMGPTKLWEGFHQSYGPNFVGLKPPTDAKLSFVNKNNLVFSELIHGF